MSFKPTQFEIQEEGKKSEARVVKEAVDGSRNVQPFIPSSIRAPGQGTYNATRAKAGPLAATDVDRHSRSQKDSRFSLSSTVRGPLAIEEEERRIIDQRVQAGVEALSEQVRKQAFEEGYQAGEEKGQEDARAQFHEEAQASLSRLNALLDSMESSRTEIFKANERFVVELVFKVARMVLLRDLKADKDYVSRLCQQLIERVGARENIRVRVNPEDVEIIAKLKGDLESTFGALQSLNIEVSPQVEGGGCLVETQWNAIDASVETQLRNIHASLTGTGES